MELGQLLDGSLTATGALRSECEAQLTARLQVPGFALQLCEFLFTESAATNIAQRQLACVLLKQLVKARWTLAADDEQSEEGGIPTATPASVVQDQEKQQVKHAIVLALQHRVALFEESKVQTALCLAIAAIFERDWPDQWTEILPVVLQMIAGEDKLQIAFAIRFLSLTGGHFSSEHCTELVAHVFPHLQRVFTAPQDFPVGVRTRVVRIVQSSLVMVGMEAQVGNDTARQLLLANITQWISLLLTQLSTSVEQVKDWAMKIQVLATLNSFVQEWPKDMSDLLPQIMPQIYALLANNLATFEHNVILNASEEEDGYDSDGEGVQIGNSAMIVAAFEFLRATMHAPTKKTRQLVLSALPDFIYVMIAYAQITMNQMEVWEEDPNKYVADEDDDSLSYNIRNAATDLLTELEAVLGRKAVVAALSAVQRHLNATENSNWRLQESALLVVGCLAAPTLAALSKNASDVGELMNLSSFLQTLFTVMNMANEEIYLRARALWCASRLAKGMNPEMLDMFLQVAISGLEHNQVLPVRMYACRSIGAIIKLESGKSRLQGAATAVITRLTHLAEQATDETLHIALETLVVVLQETEMLDVESAKTVVTCFLYHWSQNLNDPLISELIDGAFGALVEIDNLEIIASLHEQVLPVLRSMLIKSKLNLQADGNGVNTAGSAITILKTLVRHSFLSSSSGGSAVTDEITRQMGAQIIQQVFEPLIDVLGTVEDEKVLNAGAECLKWLVMFAVGPLAAYKCTSVAPQGGSGIDATMDVAAKLLSPSLADSCAICVGGLITQILLKVGPTLPATTVQSILSAVSTRLASAELPSLVQSLCLVFARLVHTHGRDLLGVLEQLPAPPRMHATTNPEPNNLLQFVFGTWIEKQADFYGLYCMKVTMSALLKVVEWNDPRINEILVTGSEIESSLEASSAGIQTRSRAKNSQEKRFATVHFLSKFVVVLAKTMNHLSEEEDEWESSEDEDESSGEEDDEGQAHPSGAQSSIFAPAGRNQLYFV